MCLLNDVPVEVQALRWVTHQWLVLGSSFCGCDLSNLEPADHGITIANRCLQRLFFAMVANEGSMESLQPASSICMVSCQSGG